MTQAATDVADNLAAGHYQRRHGRRVLLLGGLALALLLSLALDITTGPSGMSLSRLLQVLWDPGSMPRVEAVIVWNVRLPYALMAAPTSTAIRA